MRKVRGSQQEKPLKIEVGTDTVYVRSEIELIEEEDFHGWEYSEKQYKKDDYIQLISEESEQLKTTNTLLTSEIAKMKIDLMMMKGGAL